MPEKVRSLRLQQEKVSRFLDYQEIITNGRFLRDPARNLLVIEIVKNILIICKLLHELSGEGCELSLLYLVVI